MTIMLSQKTLLAAAARYIELANKHKGVQGHANYDWCSSPSYNHHISSADAILRLVEKEVISKARVGRSLKGLTKRLASLEG